MPKIILSLKCRKCGHEQEDWFTSEERDTISAGEVLCKKCEEGEVFIMLGKPQFSIRGEGVYSPGKH